MKRNLSKGLAILLILCLLTCGAQGAGNNVTDPLPIKTLEQQMAEEAAREVARLDWAELRHISRIADYKSNEWQYVGWGTYDLERCGDWTRYHSKDGSDVYYDDMGVLYVTGDVNLVFPCVNWNGRPEGWIYDARHNKYLNLTTEYCVPIGCGRGYHMSHDELKDIRHRVDLADAKAREFVVRVMKAHLEEMYRICKHIKDGMEKYISEL